MFFNKLRFYLSRFIYSVLLHVYMPVTSKCSFRNFLLFIFFSYAYRHFNNLIQSIFDSSTHIFMLTFTQIWQCLFNKDKQLILLITKKETNIERLLNYIKYMFPYMLVVGKLLHLKYIFQLCIFVI